MGVGADQARVLLEANADPNAVSRLGRTALNKCRSAEQAQTLLEAGADPGIRDKYGESPLETSWTQDVINVLLDVLEEVPQKEELIPLVQRWAVARRAALQATRSTLEANDDFSVTVIDDICDFAFNTSLMAQV